jgi:hypothetical protein
MSFKLKSKVEDFDEEESLIIFRVFWGLYLGGDLSVLGLNRVHINAMEILKEMELKISNPDCMIKFVCSWVETWESPVTNSKKYVMHLLQK